MTETTITVDEAFQQKPFDNATLYFQDGAIDILITGITQDGDDFVLYSPKQFSPIPAYGFERLKLVPRQQPPGDHDTAYDSAGRLIVDDERFGGKPTDPLAQEARALGATVTPLDMSKLEGEALVHATVDELAKILPKPDLDMIEGMWQATQEALEKAIEELLAAKRENNALNTKLTSAEDAASHALKLEALLDEFFNRLGEPVQRMPVYTNTDLRFQYERALGGVRKRLDEIETDLMQWQALVKVFLMETPGEAREDESLDATRKALLERGAMLKRFEQYALTLETIACNALSEAPDLKDYLARMDMLNATAAFAEAKTRFEIAERARKAIKAAGQQ